MKYKMILYAIIYALVLPGAIGNATEELDTHRLTEERILDERCIGFTTMIDLTMENASGQRRFYRMRLDQKKENGACIKKLFMVDAPMHLKGTALLIHSHEGKQNEQWLYLSARKRIKKIYPCFQSSQFLNTEWTYEDMGGLSGKYTPIFLRETIENGKAFRIEEFVPTDNPHSGYSRQLRWFEKETNQLHKIEYFDRRNLKLKTMRIDNYQQLDGHRIYIKKMNVKNHQTGKNMTLSFSECKTNIELGNRKFSENTFYKRLSNSGGRLCLAMER